MSCILPPPHLPPFNLASPLCCTLIYPLFRDLVDCPPGHRPLPPASNACLCDSLPCCPRPATQWPSRPLKSRAIGPFLLPLTPSVRPPLFHHQRDKRPCRPQWFIPSAVPSFCLRLPRPLHSSSALDLPPRFPVGPEDNRFAILRFSCPPACVLLPLLPLCRPVYLCLMVSSDAWILFVGVSFCMLVIGQGASTPWRSLVPARAHTLLGHASVVQADQPPPPFPS